MRCCWSSDRAGLSATAWRPRRRRSRHAAIGSGSCRAVDPPDIPGWTAAADVAAIPIQPTTLNHRLTTPTRLFDALGAGVPVVASDLPGMAAIVRRYGCGVLCVPSDPTSIAEALRDVLDGPPERRQAFRDAALAAARGRTPGIARSMLLRVYGRLTGGDEAV